MKFGKVKHEHSMLEGLEALLKQLLEECPSVQRIVPGRIHRRKGRGVAQLKLQYPTPTGLKCLYLVGGATQEVFLVGGRSEEVEAWLRSRI